MEDFEKLISKHCIRLYNLCNFIIKGEHRDIVLNRRFLGRLNMESTWMEETLDAAGARHSERWFPFREAVSAIKLFSTVCYDLLHVKNSFPYYNLIETRNSFMKDSEEVLEDIYNSLVKTSDYIIKKARKCGLHDRYDVLDVSQFEDIQVSSILRSDRKLRHIDNPGKTLIYLSTEFINLKSDMGLVRKSHSLKKSEYKTYIPATLSEEKLRLVLVRFHNLQSLYDTYLSESDIEDVDKRLRSMRGHISFIYHMLKSATNFSHYYERHIIPRQNSIFFKNLLPMNEERFLEITIDFFMHYYECYFDSAKELCFDVIDSYAEIGERIVPIPVYRGFHVRPSSLVSKIVNYYGGRVRMFINEAEYDPSTPLELFRVNEEINALKRVRLYDLILKEKISGNDIGILLDILKKRGEVVVYDCDLGDLSIKDDESSMEYSKRVLALLLASGKIDIRMDIKVKFVGDMRAIGDIEILAQNGYGEDKMGNNINLPKKLSYLRR